jgi:hypothetical protein
MVGEDDKMGGEPASCGATIFDPLLLNSVWAKPGKILELGYLRRI